MRISDWSSDVCSSDLSTSIASVDVRPGDALGTSMCLALRAAAPCKSAILPICRTSRGTHQITSLRHIRKTPLAGRLAYVAEGRGFVHTKRALDAYNRSEKSLVGKGGVCTYRSRL